MSRKKDSRDKKVTSSMEDYLEAIFEIAQDNGSPEVRVTDIARRLGVTRPSVVGMLKHLVGRGLAEHEHYGAVTLTEAGEEIAIKTLRIHNVLRTFLEEALGLDASVAEKDACRMEHTLSPETIERFVALEEFRETNQELVRERSDMFRKFLRDRVGKK